MNKPAARVWWWVLLAAAGTFALTMGTRQTMGFFLSPLNTATGLGLASISLAFAFGQLWWGLTQPFAGALADRLGAGWVLFAGIVLVALGTVLTPLMTSTGGLIFAIGVLAAGGAGMAGPSVLMAATSRLIPPERRGLATGVVNAGGSFGQFLMAPIAAALTAALGWASALQVLGAVVLLALPAAWVLRGSPAGAVHATAPQAPLPARQAMARAWAEPSYRLLMAGFFVCGFHVAFLATHMPGVVAACGLPAAVGAWALGVIGLFNIIGSLAMGWAVGRWRMKSLLTLVYATRALAVLQYFLETRCAHYRGGISSPLSAPDACSRLSPYLAWGCLSLREVVQATRLQMARLPPQAGRARAGLNAFMSRLYWHCHFIQKLESEPAIEWQNMHRGYDGLREHDFNPAHFEALQAGRTGWPMVDACVAMLRETGWLNFRMRAMLVSVAAYPLWLHWRPVGEWLARQFLDYEPGIHWSQLQMQSGTTGINTTRVYNPVKQAQDHDPQGLFVRRWLPAMRRVPDTWLFEPWHMPPSVQQQCGVRVGHDIAQPLVDLAQATREAKARLHARRAEPAVKAAQADVVERHASRRRMGVRQAEWRGAPRENPQLGLDFGD